MEVFILMEDADGTTFSTPKPIGVVVTDEAVAKEWVSKATAFGSRKYEKAKVVDKI